MPIPLTGFRINGLDDVQSPLSGLVNSFFEVEAPTGTAGQYVNLRLRGDRLRQWLNEGIGPVAAVPIGVFRNLYDNQGLGLYAGKTLLLTGRAGGLVVRVLCTGNAEVNGADAYTYDPATEAYLPVNYNPATDTVSARLALPPIVLPGDEGKVLGVVNGLPAWVNGGTAPAPPAAPTDLAVSSSREASFTPAVGKIAADYEYQLV